MPKPQKHVFICSQSRPPGHPRGSCGHSGSNEVLQAFWQEQQKRNAFAAVGVTYSGCLGPCSEGPNVLVYPEGVLYNKVTPADVIEIFDEHLVGGKPVERLLAKPEVW